MKDPLRPAIPRLPCPNSASSSRLRALRSRSPSRTLHRPHAQPARPPRAPAATLTETSAPPATRRPCPPHRVAAHRLGVRIALLQFELLQNQYGRRPPDESLKRMHCASRFIAISEAPYPASSSPIAQPARSGWCYGPFASRAAAERFADEALKLSCCALHGRSGSRPIIPDASTPK